jgi:hypothetical protein
MAEKAVMLADRPALRMPSAPYGGTATPGGGSSFAGGGGGGGGALDAPSGASVGNFKGVMLCNRPDPMAGGGQAGGDGAPAFRVAGSHEAFHPGGQNTGLRERLGGRRGGRRGPNPQVARVKEYLAELAARKEDLLRQREDEEARAEERRRRLAESQRALRELIRANVGSDDDGGGGGGGGAGARSGAYTHLDDGKAGKKRAAAGGGAGAGAANKPAWAKSEAAVAADEDAEADDLLDFAGKLDYDNYVGDLEDKAGETLVSRRLREVEAAEAAEKGRLAELEAGDAAEAAREEARERRERRRRRARRKAREARRKAREAAAAGAGAGGDEAKKEDDADGGGLASGTDGGGHASGTDGDDTDGAGYSSGAAASADGGAARRRRGASDDDDDDDDEAENDGDSVGPLGGAGGRARRGGDDAASIATSILSNSSSIRGVHSKKSLTAVVARVQAEEAAARSAPGGGPYSGQLGADVLPVMDPAPRIVIHNEFRPALEAKKALVSNLPYQHRNPAV